MRGFYEIILWHAKKYPLMQPCDAVKLAYQNEFGSGHLCISSDVEKELSEEYERAKDTDEAFVDIGNGLTRLSVSSVRSIPAAARVIYASAFLQNGSESRFGEKLDTLLHAAEKGVFTFGADELSEYIKEYGKGGFSPVSHSGRYKSAYAPSYRVIDKRYARLMPLIYRIEEKMRKDGRATVAIDGRAASGKTTAAELIARLYDGEVVHMDDFFLPATLRSEARYAEPGGNVHYERFKTEVKEPLSRGERISYGKFSCREGKITEYTELRADGLVIVEGAYSMHPCFGDIYDIKAFCTVDKAEQLKRIQMRDGGFALESFKKLWIPLEERYISEVLCEKSLAEKSVIILND